MTFTAGDFVRLRGSLLTVVLLMLIGSGTVFAVLHFMRLEEKANKQAIEKSRDIQTRLARANDETSEIRQKIGRYREIEARGYIGQEHRLEWVERIAQIKTARRLLDIQYELSVQKPLDGALLPGGGSAGDHEFVSSTMKLQMQLLHEEDLLGFFDDLRGTVQAFLHIHGCNIERLPRTANEHSPGAQLKAECTIEWITLREKK